MKDAAIKRARLIPMFAVMGMIFFLSNQPGDTFHIPSIPGIDKVAHLLIYATLAASVLYAIHEKMAGKNSMAVSMVVVTVCFLYGIGDEFHQSFIPGRFPSVADLLADTLGAVVVCAAWFLWKRQGVKEAL